MKTWPSLTPWKLTCSTSFRFALMFIHCFWWLLLRIARVKDPHVILERYSVETPLDTGFKCCLLVNYYGWESRISSVYAITRGGVFSVVRENTFCICINLSIYSLWTPLQEKTSASLKIVCIYEPNTYIFQ